MGEDKMARLQSAHVLVVGLGGVGAYAAEMICRAGVGRMTIVDADTVQITNLNRQLPAMHSTLGMFKADVLEARFKDINPDLELKVLPVFLKDENIPDLLDADEYDFIVDAIDTLSPKCYLIYHALQRRIKIVSSMGAGAKSDITQVRFADLWDTYHCGLSKAVLQIVSADYLFHAYADRPEGDLTRIRSSLVSEGALFQFAQEINLGEYLRLGRGEERCGGRTRPSVVSDAFEAVIAALYLDGGMEVAKSFILPFITEGKHAEADYKTRLQEIVQQNPEERLSYVVEQESGPDHDKHFVVAVRFNSDKVARGEGRSKKMAEQHAAREALKLLGVIKEK